MSDDNVIRRDNFTTVKGKNGEPLKPPQRIRSDAEDFNDGPYEVVIRRVSDGSECWRATFADWKGEPGEAALATGGPGARQFCANLLAGAIRVFLGAM